MIIKEYTTLYSLACVYCGFRKTSKPDESKIIRESNLDEIVYGCYYD